MFGYLDRNADLSTSPQLQVSSANPELRVADAFEKFSENLRPAAYDTEFSCPPKFWQVTLRDAQNALAQMRHLRDQIRDRSFVVTLATGGGKSAFVMELFKLRGSALVIVDEAQGFSGNVTGVAAIDGQHRLSVLSGQNRSSSLHALLAGRALTDRRERVVGIGVIIALRRAELGVAFWSALVRCLIARLERGAPRAGFALKMMATRQRFGHRYDAGEDDEILSGHHPWRVERESGFR
ncbi:hypothetical protein OG979_21105 [Actinomadura citrea]|uniref:hypothetical protein n=1 Tax=Actinomadura citrea TaxID=46158 RepID=UPI002E2D8A62|nr:hypothetical protein [Actinomadura citrea]